MFVKYFKMYVGTCADIYIRNMYIAIHITSSHASSSGDLPFSASRAHVLGLNYVAVGQVNLRVSDHPSWGDIQDLSSGASPPLPPPHLSKGVWGMMALGARTPWWAPVARKGKR